MALGGCRPNISKLRAPRRAVHEYLSCAEQIRLGSCATGDCHDDAPHPPQSHLQVGCDIPTELPAFDTRWVVPAEEARFGAAELLPDDSVTLSADSSAFIMDFATVTFSETLGSLCSLCAVADGFTVEKPTFLGESASSVDFPSEVSSIALMSGDVLFEIDNGLNFDPCVRHRTRRARSPSPSRTTPTATSWGR